MRVKFNWGIASYSGSRDGMTYSAYREGYICVGRRWFVPAPGLSQEKIRSIGKNLGMVWKNANADYKSDFRKYAIKNDHEHYTLIEWPPTNYVLFVMMMFAWQASDPSHVDLTAVTIPDIVSSDADVRTVARAVGAGFLAPVKGYAAYTKDIDTP